MSAKTLNEFRKEELTDFVRFLVTYEGCGIGGRWIEGIEINTIEDGLPITADIKLLESAVEYYVNQSRYKE